MDNNHHQNINGMSVSLSQIPSERAAVQMDRPTGGLSTFTVNEQHVLKIFSQKTGFVMQGMCRMEEGFEALYPLFRGLCEFGTPEWLNLRFSGTDQAAFFHYPESKKQEMDGFFGRLTGLLQKEVQFKKVLKEVIINRNIFKAEQALLHSVLMG